MRIDKVTTRGGDGGETSLGDGARIAKDSARIEAIGSVDEANSAMGILIVHIAADNQGMIPLDRLDLVRRIQNDLFDVGADLCVPGEGGDRLRLTDAPSLRLEAEMAVLKEGLPDLRSFVLPGGTRGATYADAARTTVRRAERRVLALSRLEDVNPAILRFLNRLSDHMFVLSRHLNHERGAEVTWTPGENR